MSATAANRERKFCQTPWLVTCEAPAMLPACNEIFFLRRQIQRIGLSQGQINHPLTIWHLFGFIQKNQRVVMSMQSGTRKAVRFRGRSYLAYMLTPEPPIYEWLADLNSWVSQAPGYFVGKPVILDLSAVTLSNSAIVQLLSELLTRDIRIMGLEGVDPDVVGSDLPPVLVGGRPLLWLNPNPRRLRRPRRLSLRSLQHCSWKIPCAPARAWFFPMAMSRCSARSLPAPRSSPVARSTSMARSAAAPSPDRTAMNGRESFAAKSKPNCSRLAASTERLTILKRNCAATHTSLA